MEKESIFDYITKEEYESKIKGLKDSETRNIYKSGKHRNWRWKGRQTHI